MGVKTYFTFYLEEILWFDTFEGAVKHLQGNDVSVNLDVMSYSLAEKHGLMMRGYNLIEAFEVHTLNDQPIGHIAVSRRLNPS